jgi:hypothetical protein
VHNYPEIRLGTDNNSVPSLEQLARIRKRV